MDTLTITGDNRGLALLMTARHRETCFLYVQEDDRIRTKEYGRAERPICSPTERDGKSPTAKGGRPDWALFAKYKYFHFDIWSDVNWEWKDSAQLSGHAIPHGPKHVKLSDQAVFWASVYMDSYTRGQMFPADFDIKGEIRTTRQPQNPPMVIEAHGLFWFPVFKQSAILCGDYWPAMGWLLGKVERTTQQRRNPLEWNVGYVVAPPEAVNAAGRTLRLEQHGLSFSRVLLDGLPTNLIEAAKIHSIGITFQVKLDAECWVVTGRDSVGLHRQIHIPGFCAKISPSANSADPNESILPQEYTSRNLSHIYSTDYSVNMAPQPATPVNWNIVSTGRDWHPRRRFARNATGTLSTSAGAVDDEGLFRERIPARDIIPDPQGSYNPQDIAAQRSKLTDVMMARGVTTETWHFASATEKTMHLMASVKSNDYAKSIAAYNLSRNERQELKEKLTGTATLSTVDQIIADAPDGSTPYLLDYVEACDAIEMTENEGDAIPQSEAKDTVKSLLDDLKPPY